MKIEIISAERVVYSDDVDVVVAPGVDGELGIHPHHAPLLTYLQPGELKIIKGHEETLLAVSGGFLEIFDNRVVILADTAEQIEEIDEARAQEAIVRAKDLMNQGSSDIDLQRAVVSLRKAEVRLKVSRKKRNRKKAM
jgi:F-type H+-transporting ATPase subunit epsilon